MTTIVKELHDALVEAGASEDRASAAAHAVLDASARADLATRADISLVRSDLKADLAELKADLYRAMLVQSGLVIGATVALLKLLP